jgi:hypothetical protein
MKMVDYDRSESLMPKERPGPTTGRHGESVRLMSAEQVAKELFGNTVTADWVKRNLCGPHSGRIKLGHKTVRWNRPSVEAYVARLEDR